MGHHQAISTPFDEAGVIELGFTHLADIRVTSLDDQTEYLLDIDYSANAREGVIRRLPASTIPEGGDVTVHFKVAPARVHWPDGALARSRPPGGRRGAFRAADPEGEIVVPTGRYRLSTEPTNHLFIRCALTSRMPPPAWCASKGLFVGTQTDPALPIGQKFFIPAQITDPGILLVLQNSVPIVRQPSTRETFEFVVTF